MNMAHRWNDADGRKLEYSEQNTPLCPPQIPLWTLAATNHLRLDTAQTWCSCLHSFRHTCSWCYLELWQAELLLVDTGKLQVWRARVGACL